LIFLLRTSCFDVPFSLPFVRPFDRLTDDLSGTGSPFCGGFVGWLNAFFLFVFPPPYTFGTSSPSLAVFLSFPPPVHQSARRGLRSSTEKIDRGSLQFLGHHFIGFLSFTSPPWAGFLIPSRPSSASFPLFYLLLARRRFHDWQPLRLIGHAKFKPISSSCVLLRALLCVPFGGHDFFSCQSESQIPSLPSLSIGQLSCGSAVRSPAMFFFLCPRLHADNI